MTNAEMENTLSRMCSELSVMRRQLAPERYAVDDRIGYAQLAMQSACLLLGTRQWPGFIGARRGIRDESAGGDRVKENARWSNN